MTTGERIRSTMTAGVAVRRQFRALLDALGVEWTEHKGFFESTFVITATSAQWRQITESVRRFNADTNADA